ncbi:MAG TPA: glycosyltransferase family 4 protein [Bryobacterales bacterium]|nr:glycosyltransferase family 4 protein [Bryobacterales bacterium]
MSGDASAGGVSDLRIAEVAPLGVSVPPVTYGGTQRIVHFLTEELVRRGHDVTLFASGDSKTSAKLRVVRKRSLLPDINAGKVRRPDFYAVHSIGEALREAGSFDIIHCHLGPWSLPFHGLSPTPLLHTLPGLVYEDDLWMLRRYPEATVIARSRRQVAGLDGHCPNIRVIYNGCDFEAYEFSPGPVRYLAFLGRMAWEKNPLDAIAIAGQVGLPIVLAGEPKNEYEQDYFAEQIEPMIDGKNVIHIGEVTDAQKNELFRNAGALLFPVLVEEAFGIVMIEAMACGTPVVAYNRGAVSEVVDYGKTGFYADAVEELPALVTRALSLDRQTVRRHARQRFNQQRMADEYIQVYESLVK